MARVTAVPSVNLVKTRCTLECTPYGSGLPRMRIVSIPRKVPLSLQEARKLEECALSSDWPLPLSDIILIYKWTSCGKRKEHCPSLNEMY